MKPTTNMERQNTEECSQTERTAGEDQTVTGDQTDDEQIRPLAAVCAACGRTLKNARGLAIHQARPRKSNAVALSHISRMRGIRARKNTTVLRSPKLSQTL